MKKWNEHMLHQWYIKQRLGVLAHVILSDPPLMSSYPRKPETEKNLMQSQKNPESYQRDEHSVDERDLDFIAVWNPSMLEQLVSSLIRHDWKLTAYFFCSHRNSSAIPIMIMKWYWYLLLFLVMCFFLSPQSCHNKEAVKLGIKWAVGKNRPAEVWLVVLPNEV